jgi:predicted transcriptional regulator
MEKVPVYSEAERVEMIASLKQGEADIAAGRCVQLEVGEIAPWLKEKVRKARTKKEHGV